MDSAVSDSDVFIHLAKLGMLDLLQNQFDHVYVSPLVQLEVVDQGIETSKSDAKLLQEFFQTRTIEICQVRKSAIRNMAIKHQIHLGEASILAVGKEIGVPFCLSNEIRVRRAARTEGFKVVGTLGILLRGNTNGQISDEQIDVLLQEIQDHPETFRIHPKVIQKIREQLEP